jgi:uncharacterized lipoprotein YddW (UPF0748 family)
MDPIATAVATILGKYAIDKGATLVKEAGKSAAEAAGKLFERVMNRLKADPAEAKNAERFEKEPEKHQELIGEVLDEQLKSDPNFRAELQALLAELQKAGGATIIQAAGNVGDVFTGENAAKLQDNYGTVQVGGTHTTNRTGGTDINAQGGTVNLTGDIVGRDNKKN